MQVNDSPAPPPAASAIKDQVRADGDGPAAGRSRSGSGFQRALERKRRQPAGNGAPGDATSGAALAGWFRAEPAAPTAKGPAVAAVGAARAVDRVLIGSGPQGAEARIRISAGALAGTEIHLSSAAAGRAVEARLLTHTASSRQTLSVVMDELEAGAGDPAQRRPDEPPGSRR